MPSLKEMLTDDSRFDRVIRACEGLVENEVANKRGLSGGAVKAGFKVVKKVKPGIIGSALRALVPHFCDALDPVFQEAVEAGADGAADRFASSLRGDKGGTAERLLSVTDRKISDASAPVQKTYKGLRKAAKGHVEDAVPGLVDTLVPFVRESVTA
jgi:hypothetical protein